MAGNEVTLTIAGDATQLQRAAERASGAMAEVEAAVTDTNQAMEAASQQSQGFTDRLGKLGAGIEGLTGAMDSAAAGLQAVADLQSLASRRADEMKRNVLAVEQAEGDLDQAHGDLKQSTLDLDQAFGDLEQSKRDLNRAMLDGKQAILDEEAAQVAARQAVLDAAIAQGEYNKAVKEHGANSAEAQQASIDLATAQNDLKQANLDVESAQEDAKQAIEDGNQAARDGKQAQEDANQAKRDGAQASRDARSAQLDLNEAQRAANPSELQKVANTITMLTPIMTGLISVVALVTAAQWAWNAAQLASPTTWIILGIVALVAAIVLIATKTTWFQTLWEKVWGGIKAYFEFVVNSYKTVFEAVWGAILAYFNFVVGAWKKALQTVMDAVNWLMDGFRRIPGLLSSAFSGLFGIITAPFRAAFNFVSDAWNNTIGRLRWTVPSWVPGVGGNSISAPTLPKYHSGGVVPGPPGMEVAAILQAGETVTPRGMSASSSAPAPSWLPTGDVLADLVLEALAGRIRARGGDPSILGMADG